jgi:hypothetical protein
MQKIILFYIEKFNTILENKTYYTDCGIVLKP